nr:hypothetical protein [Tanacetum cinerariifolium]
MFQAKASKERLDLVKSLMACKPKPRASICAFVLEMKGYFNRLEYLNMVFDVELSINIIISGCEVYVRREAQDKLEARSKKCIFVSYPEESFGFFYKPIDNVVFVARRGVFLEREMISKEDGGKVVSTVNPDDISLPIHRTSGIVSKPPQFYYGFHIEEDNISDSILSELDEPADYKEAMAIPEAAK